MRTLRAFWARLFGVFNSKRIDDDFDAELQSHIAAHSEEGLRAGLTAEEARRQALLRLGGVEQTRQHYRDRMTLPWLEHLARDVRYALRGFRRNPAFAVTAILTLTLGIGATAAVFSVVDRVLFRSLPYANDDRLVSVGLVQSLERQEFTLGGFFYEWRDHQKPFEAMTFERGTHECNLSENNPLHSAMRVGGSEFSFHLGDIAPGRPQFCAGGGRPAWAPLCDHLGRALAEPVQSGSRCSEQIDCYRRPTVSDRRCAAEEFRDAQIAGGRSGRARADRHRSSAFCKCGNRISDVGLCPVEAGHQHCGGKGADGTAISAHATVDSRGDPQGLSSRGALPSRSPDAE